MCNRTYCDRKSQLPEILTEPLNPREINCHIDSKVEDIINY